MFEVVPAINCKNFSCVEKRFDQMRDFGNEWVHIDISDGKFNPVTTWNNPEELKQFLKENDLNFEIEVHLMVAYPRRFYKEWLEAGAKKLIIHLESARKIGEAELQKIIEEVSEAGAEVMLAISPETPAEELTPYFDRVYQFQLLAVSPGLSGQKFDERIPEKVKFLRERSGDFFIEVDGGMNLESAKLVRRCGADAVASASYIFGNKNPLQAYQNLLEVDKMLYEERV